jgi:GTPase SAR1 family protein
MYVGTPSKEDLIEASYYAPRGRRRLFQMGGELAHRYLQPSDCLVGVIGTEGSGKSTLIKGLFPGLELTNDDDGVNNRVAPIYDFDPDDFFSHHTFHLDVRYELAFHQIHEIVDAINRVLEKERRIIVEHFDLLYPHIKRNADIIFAIGEDISVYRPTIFGPSPLKIKAQVEKNTKYRLMAHSAEDIVGNIIERDYNLKPNIQHSDVNHGFVIQFDEKPSLDLHALEKEVLAIIAKDLPIRPCKGDRISIDGVEVACTGKRIHVASTGLIENFRLLKSFYLDPATKKYLLVGVVGHYDSSELWEPPCES